MQNGVGTKLREARKRRELEISEAEAATKIRGRFLHAIEDEDWEALPGPAYARGFVRAYGAYLGLDGERLASECPVSPAAASSEAGARAGRRSGPRFRGLLATAVALALVGVVVLIGVLWNGGGGGSGPSGGRQGDAANGAGHPPAPAAPPAVQPDAGQMALSLEAVGEVWVCLLDARGKALVDGLVLPAGAEEGPFSSGSFTVSFGNGEVEMQVDGRKSAIPQSSSPLGYEVASGGSLSPLSEAQRPTCT